MTALTPARLAEPPRAVGSPAQHREAESKDYVPRCRLGKVGSQKFQGQNEGRASAALAWGPKFKGHPSLSHQDK